MNKSTMPNMTALLGLLAIAGYKNRDKISAMLAKAQESLTSASAPEQAESASQLNEMFGGAAASSGTVVGGLSDVLDRFKQAGERQTADSWLGAGPNKPVLPESLEQIIGSETLDDLAAKIGLNKQEILSRLSVDLPNVVNDFTPMGRLPTEQEARGFR
ncbi:MAG: YidB family protein [Burkholderiaceae bacterium]